LKIMMNHQWRRSAGAFVCLCSMTPIGLTSTPAQTPAPADQASQVSAPAIAETRLTLQSAVDRAVANYPTVRIALQRLLAAKESVGLTRTQYLPQANVLWQTNRSTYNNIPGLLMPQGVIPVLSGTVLANTSGTSVWGSAGGLLMNWEPTRFGYRKAEVAAAQAGSNAAGDRLALTKLDVSSAAASAYLTVATLHEQVKSAQADLSRRETFAKTIHVLVDSQLRPGADASEADAEVAASRTRLIQAQTQEKVSLAALAELLVLPSSQITLNSDSLLVADASTDVPAFAAASHPLALEQSHLLDQTKSVEQVWSKAYAPRFSLEGAVSGRGSGVKPDGTLLGGVNGLAPDRENWAIGIQATFAPFDYFSIREQKRIAASNEQAQKLNYQNTVEALNTQVEQTRIEFDGARQIAQNTPVELASARMAELQARARYQAGLANIVEVTQAQSLLQQAESDDAAARIAVWQALLNVCAAQGDLTPFLNQLPGQSAGGH
jgi:outer membrane protein